MVSMRAIQRITKDRPLLIRCIETSEIQSVWEWAGQIAAKREIKPASVAARFYASSRLNMDERPIYGLHWEVYNG